MNSGFKKRRTERSMLPFIEVQWSFWKLKVFPELSGYHVPNVLGHFLPKCSEFWALKKFPHGDPKWDDTKVTSQCPKWGGWLRQLLDNVQKKDAFFWMSSLRGRQFLNVIFVILNAEDPIKLNQKDMSGLYVLDGLSQYLFFSSNAPF